MPAEATNGGVTLGPIRVCADEDHVERYRRETGFGDTLEKIVPTAFPAVWLSADEIGRVIRGELEGEDAVPVHESQSFHYVAPLRVGEAYDLVVTLRREQAPPRLVVTASVSTPGGELRCNAEALLRIVSRPVVDAPR